MRFPLILILLLLTSINSFCQETSSIDFVIKNLGINVDGHFKSFSVTSKYDTSGNLQSISGEITVKSIETGIDSRDEHLLEDDYFNVTKFPKIILKSSQIVKRSSNLYTVKAKLTIKGKSKQVSIPVKVSKTDLNRKMVSEFEINRRDFDVGGGSLVMSKTVKIKVVHIEKL